ncbi:hypothetical protein F4781DRAFT_338338 [Annulohypoxylon bovei var. microspora]|nr:hypothetical protein F4781DRAFT_338338 [Annulohypoxylon bovei var. microspora]
MQSFTYLTIAVAALLQGAVAAPAPEVTSSPTSLPGHYVCTSITTVTTTVSPAFHCDIACLKPSSTCKPGEPTAKPYPSTTTTPLPGCTVSVIAEKPACGNCATCVEPLPTA